MVDVASQVGQELKTALGQLYGSRFSELILFGSYAKGSYHTESDVDFAIVLADDSFSPASEILRITPYTTAIGIRYNVAVSILPVSKKRLQVSPYRFMKPFARKVLRYESTGTIRMSQR